MSPEEIVRASADAAEHAVEAPLFSELMGNTVAVFGATLATRIAPEDTPGLLVPVDVLRKGKARLGAVLMLDTRVIVTWIVRRLRAKRHVMEIPRGEITSAELTPTSGRLASESTETVLMHTTDDAWQLALTQIPGPRSIAPAMLSALGGSEASAAG